MAKRGTARYQLKRPGGKILHRGITDRPISERKSEHQSRFPGTRIAKVGPRITRKSALRWEREGGKRL